jgi:hypothetical protein
MKIKPVLQGAHRAFASSINTIIAQTLIVILVFMIYMVELASQATTAVY